MKERLKSRAMELDLLRGFAVLLMMLDHLMYDFWGLLPGLIMLSADLPHLCTALGPRVTLGR